MGGDRKPGPTRRPDRAAAEDELMRAAVEMLQREGILNGLSTQQVADRAGLNRGLVHHYFGGKRGLLRAAIARRIKMAAPVNETWRRESPRRKRRAHFRQSVQDAEFAQMIALLAIDRDPGLMPIPFHEERLEDLRREQADGLIAADVDLVAQLALWEATVTGYAVLRSSLSSQLGLRPEVLDKRVLDVLEQHYGS